MLEGLGGHGGLEDVRCVWHRRRRLGHNSRSIVFLHPRVRPQLRNRRPAQPSPDPVSDEMISLSSSGDLFCGSGCSMERMSCSISSVIQGGTLNSARLILRKSVPRLVSSKGSRPAVMANRHTPVQAFDKMTTLQTWFGSKVSSSSNAQDAFLLSSSLHL